METADSTIGGRVVTTAGVLECSAKGSGVGGAGSGMGSDDPATSTMGMVITALGPWTFMGEGRATRGGGGTAGFCCEAPLGSVAGGGIPGRVRATLAALLSWAVTSAGKAA